MRQNKAKHLFKASAYEPAKIKAKGWIEMSVDNITFDAR